MPEFQIVVRAFILNDKGHVLLLKRGKEPHQGKWSLPGGKVEFGESSVGAVKRELMEELGIAYEPHFEFYKEDYISVPDIHAIVLYFSGTYKGTIELKEPEKLLDYKFVGEKDVAENSDIAFDHKERLQEYFTTRS